ncbi:MAG: DUF4867 family protein [Bacilli bacterium]|jgi:hypothetical protein|nr:DUF4867 family protein [Bacilli bacterium]
MKIHSIQEELFSEYGRVVEGLDVNDLVKTLKDKTPLPQEGTVYTPSDKNLESLPVFEVLKQNVYGGMPIQLGYCNGHNTKLNCLEYHRDSEINLGTEDFILLLAKRSEIKNNLLDTKKVVAFYVPKNVAVEVYATTLHYAPCEAKVGQGFKVLVVLPRGTNGPLPKIVKPFENAEFAFLWASNKWLLAHEESSEASKGAKVGLVGTNIDISKDIAK